MDIKIYQVYFDQSHHPKLDSAFIPYDNTKNQKPELREYPILCDLYGENKDFDGYWGITSWRWREKRGPDGAKYLDWINNNPGYDVYHYNHVPNMVKRHNNSIAQGDGSHPGLKKYMINLMGHMNHSIDFDSKFSDELFIVSHFYVGNQKFWSNWMKFLNDALAISNKEKELHDFLFNSTSRHYAGNGNKENLINFSFAVERLVVVFLKLHPEYKILSYPSVVQHIPSVLTR